MNNCAILSNAIQHIFCKPCDLQTHYQASSNLAYQPLLRKHLCCLHSSNVIESLLKHYIIKKNVMRITTKNKKKLLQRLCKPFIKHRASTLHSAIVLDERSFWLEKHDCCKVFANKSL
jgi:hypothetical protein